MAVGVCWCVLTNGDEYRIYNSHAEVDADQKLFRTVRVSDSDPKLLTDTLLLLGRDMMRGSMLDELWKAHFVDRNVRLALESLLAAPDRGLERLIRKKVRALKAADIRSSLKRAKIKIDFPSPSAAIDQEKVAPMRDAERGKKGVTSRHEAGKKAAATARAMADATLDSLIAFGLI